MRDDGHVELAEGSLVDGGRLRIVEDLAEGAMSAVYLALEVDGGRAVALKVLGGKYAVRADARPRLLAEQTYTQAMAGHPGIIPVLYAGTLPEADGAPYLALEYVHGPTLAAYCISRRDDTRLLLRLLRELAAIVADVHAAGIIHRDIKPRNVLVADPQGNPVLRLTDFGLSRRIDSSDEDGRLTGDHDRPGTKHYMAPEQCTSNNVGTAVDVYALGVSAYQLFVGETPWGDRTELDVVRRKCDPSLPGFSIASLSFGLPGCVVAAIDGAMEYAAERRPSAAAFRDAMDEGLRALEVAGAGAGRTEVVRAVAGTASQRRVRSPRIDAPVFPPAPVAAQMPRGAYDRRRLWAGGTVLLLAVGAVVVVAVSRGVPSAAVREQPPVPAALVNTSAADASSGVADKRPSARASTQRPASPTPHPGEPTSMPASAAPKSVGPGRKPSPKPPRPSDAADTAGGPAEPEPASTPECAAVRSAADDAQGDGAYAKVLEHTRRKECWADKRVLKRLQVMAYAQTSQFERCANAGKSSSDPEVRTLADACAARLGEGSQ